MAITIRRKGTNFIPSAKQIDGNFSFHGQFLNNSKTCNDEITTQGITYSVSYVFLSRWMEGL